MGLRDLYRLKYSLVGSLKLGRTNFRTIEKKMNCSVIAPPYHQLPANIDQLLYALLEITFQYIFKYFACDLSKCACVLVGSFFGLYTLLEQPSSESSSTRTISSLVSFTYKHAGKAYKRTIKRMDRAGFEPTIPRVQGGYTTSLYYRPT